MKFTSIHRVNQHRENNMAAKKGTQKKKKGVKKPSKELTAKQKKFFGSRAERGLKGGRKAADK